MTDEEFEEYAHESTHQLMELQEQCKQEFKVGKWPHWDYDLDAGTLTFSDEDRTPQVIADIQVVGTTSKRSNTWLWSWDNSSLATQSTHAMAAVRDFGEAEQIRGLKTAELPDDEYLGWKLTSVTASILKAKGAYRCPSDNGFLYVVFTTIQWADDYVEKPKMIECANHGPAFATFICEHLGADPKQKWIGDAPTAENKWPDAWCEACDKQWHHEEGHPDRPKNILLCHHCYEKKRLNERMHRWLF